MKSLKILREQAHVSQQTIANALGISRQAYCNYEVGKRTPDIWMIEKIARYYSVPIESLLSDDAVPSASIKIPVLGSVPAGIPIEAIEDIVDWEEIPKQMTAGGKNYFGLVVVGDSMYPKYLPGDTIIVRRQPDFSSGEDCVVYVNGYNATLKTVIRNEDQTITLRPANPEYPPHTYSADESSNGYISIAGVVVELRRKIKL